MMRRQHRVLPGMPLTAIVTLRAVSWGYRWHHPRSLHPLKMTSQRSLLTKPRCRPEREFAGGGSELRRPRSQTRHLLTAYFGCPLRRAYVRLGRRAGGGGGQGSLRFSQFPSRRPWFRCVFLCDGRSYSRRVYGKYGTMICLAGNVGKCVCRLHPSNDRHFCLWPTCRKCRPDTSATFCYVGHFFGCRRRVSETCCRHTFLHVRMNQ